MIKGERKRTKASLQREDSSERQPYSQCRRSIASAIFADNYMVGVDDQTGDIEVGLWPDVTGWSNRYPLTFGCCFGNGSPYRKSVADDFERALYFGARRGAAEREFAKIGRRASPRERAPRAAR